MSEIQYPAHPGECLRDSVEASGLTQNEIAAKLNMDRGSLRRLLTGRSPITPKSARALEAIGWSAAEHWMRLQAVFDNHPMKPIDAETPEELKRILRERDVQMPPRGKNRTNNHTETWVACRLLAALAESSLLQYPLRVAHFDRPDLIITLPSGQIGIELVEAIATDQARVDAQINFNRADNESSDVEVIPISRIRVSDARRSQPEIKALARCKAWNEPPFMGDSIERDWLEGMLHFIEKKVERFSHEEFTKYPINWLQIHDNWSPSPYENIAIDMLERKLSESEWQKPFNKVFVQRSHSIWEFAKDFQVVKHPIPQPWLPE